MHINGKSDPDPIFINGVNLEYVSDMKYLGSIKEENGSCSKDVKTRIAMAKKKMVDLNSVWKDRGIPTFLKIKLLKCLIWPVMLREMVEQCRERDGWRALVASHVAPTVDHSNDDR